MVEEIPNDQMQDVLLIEYSKLPIPLPLNHPYISFYHDKNLDKSYIIISTMYRSLTTKPGIHSYDIDTMQYRQITSYPDGFEPHCHCHAIKDHKVYVLGGTHSVYGIFDLIDKKWTIKDIGIANIVNVIPEKNSNIFHIFGRRDIDSFDSDESVEYDRRSTHWTLSNENISEISKIGKGSNFWCGEQDIHYHENAKKLILIDDNIWIYNILNNDAHWTQKMDIKAPSVIKEYSYHTVIAFEWIIFAFSFKGDIWCFDLLSMSWYESKYKAPTDWFLLDIMMLFDPISNKLHCITFEGPLYHYKVDICRYIPMEILQIHQHRFDALISGYVHGIENVSKIFIPNHLISLILAFYNVFL